MSPVNRSTSRIHECIPPVGCARVVFVDFNRGSAKTYPVPSHLGRAREVGEIVRSLELTSRDCEQGRGEDLDAWAKDVLNGFVQPVSVPRDLKIKRNPLDVVIVEDGRDDR